MKRVTFVSLFILTHLFFIFFQINKHNKFINLSYTKQKYENEIKTLMQKKQELSQNLHNLQKSSTIKNFAREKLGMCGINIKQVKKIDLVHVSFEQAEKLAIFDDAKNSEGNLSKPEEPTSLATLRYGPKGPTQGERGGEYLTLTSIQKESELKNKRELGCITLSLVQKSSTIKHNKNTKEIKLAATKRNSRKKEKIKLANNNTRVQS